MLTLFCACCELERNFAARKPFEILNLLCSQSKFNYGVESVRRLLRVSEKIGESIEFGGARSWDQHSSKHLELPTSSEFFSSSFWKLILESFSFDAFLSTKLLSASFASRFGAGKDKKNYSPRRSSSRSVSSLIQQRRGASGNEIEFFNNIIHFYYYARYHFSRSSALDIAVFLRFHSAA